MQYQTEQEQFTTSEPGDEYARRNRGRDGLRRQQYLSPRSAPVRKAQRGSL